MSDTKIKKVVVAISGGVDSSVAAFLLKKEGYEVIGVFMRLGDNYMESESAARAVCQKLDIKFFPVNLAEKFHDEIINYFLDAYRDGLTPNPCVKCNKLIKFGELLRVADELEADYLATGHYLKNKKVGDIYRLYRGSDSQKDQTYFLYNLGQEQLVRILFPISEYQKDEVREIADREKLPYLVKESQDVCFLNKNGKIIDHNDYLAEHLDQKPGPIKNMDGEILGEHKGLPFYTIGQRRGVEIGGTGPFYVAKCDYDTNTLYVVNDLNDPALFSSSLQVTEVNWVSGVEPQMPYKCSSVFRYRHIPVDSIIEKIDNEYYVKFIEPQRAITRGQSIVFYDEDELIGGGVID